MVKVGGAYQIGPLIQGLMIPTPDNYILTAFQCIMVSEYPSDSEAV